MLLEVQCEFSPSVMIWAAMPSPMCLSEFHTQLLGNFRTLHTPASEKLYGDADLTFKQDSVLAHTTSAGSTTMTLLRLLGQQTLLILAQNKSYGLKSRGRKDTPDQTMQIITINVTCAPIMPEQWSRATDWSPPCHTALMQ